MNPGLYCSVTKTNIAVWDFIILVTGNSLDPIDYHESSYGSVAVGLNVFRDNKTKTKSTITRWGAMPCLCASKKSDFSTQVMFQFWLILEEYYKQIYSLIASIFAHDDGHKMSRIWKYSETNLHNKNFGVDEACHCTKQSLRVSCMGTWPSLDHRSPIVTRGYSYNRSNVILASVFLAYERKLCNISRRRKVLLTCIFSFTWIHTPPPTPVVLSFLKTLYLVICISSFFMYWHSQVLLTQIMSKLLSSHLSG